ncbi:hypothetical protein GCM10023310_19340 [Paenibacillus vulneris]
MLLDDTSVGKWTNVRCCFRHIYTKSTSCARLAFFVVNFTWKAWCDGVRLIINGEAREVDQVTNVAELLTVFKLEQKILVIELNRDIIERSEYANTALKEGDSLEIVHFVGGG